VVKYTYAILLFNIDTSVVFMFRSFECYFPRFGIRVFWARADKTNLTMEIRQV